MNATTRMCGVDEAGRGPLAGPVYAAAVILNPDVPIVGLADSKKLSARQREKLFERIQSDALAWAIAYATVEEIDAINILQASLLAMRRAVAALSVQPNELLVDGTHVPQFGNEAGVMKARAIVKGDSTVPAISAASILAKVERDRVMLELHAQYPQYGFDKHKGYPTAAHVAALRAHGVSDVHRRSFAPVRSLLI